MARRWCGTLKHTTPIRRRTEDRSLSPRSEPDSRLSSANTDFQSPKRAIDSRAGVPMSGSNTLALVFVLVLASVVRADGCKFRSDGRFVPEREQLALVEWRSEERRVGKECRSRWSAYQSNKDEITRMSRKR